MLRVIARNGRFVLGAYRREMKVIRYLAELDKIFGVPATTRGLGTFAAIAKALDGEAT